MKLIFKKIILLFFFIIIPFAQAGVNSNRNNIQTNNNSVTGYPPLTIEYRGKKGTLFIGKHTKGNKKPVYFLTNQGKDFDFVTDLPFDDIITVFLYEEPGSKNMDVYVLGRKRHDIEDRMGFDYNFTSLELEFDKNNILRVIHYPDPLLSTMNINCFEGISYGKKEKCEYTDELSFKSYLKNRYK